MCIQEYCVLQSQRNILSEPNSPTDGEFPDVMSISHGVPGAGSGKLLNIDEEKLRREDVTRFLSGIKVPPCELTERENVLHTVWDTAHTPPYT